LLWNCLIRNVIDGSKEERLEVTGRRGRRGKHLVNGIKKRRRYWKLKAEALDRAVWTTGFGRGFGLFFRQTTY
jgi:hypothetical protein